ncbi:hypothetical protein BH09VER1_BH09VER1_42440 [soil metagenome]
MSQASIATSDQALSATYRDYNAGKLAYGLMVLCGLSVLVVPGGFVLDYFLYPQKFALFLALRMGCAVVLLALIGLLYLEKDRHHLTRIKALGIFSALVVNSTMCAMIYETEGAKSPYFVGLTLVLTCWAILSPWTVVETTIMCFLSLAAYMTACVANPSFAGVASIPLLGFGSFFLIITTTVCVGITYYLSRARFDDFRLRHQLDAQNRELQDLDRLKTQFFSNVSHELRTPLTLILGPVETLLSRGDALETRVHEGLLLIHRNTLRLLKLINDLLDLTKLDQGAEVLRKKSIPLASFVKGIVESVRHLGLSKQLRIKIEEGDPKLEAVADPSRLEKVLINLLTNALKYTPAGGTITVRWFGDAQETGIEVQDTGVGIPAEDLPKIFDRFHQVRSNLANQNQGVGIGLALAKELVDEHGGKLEVESVVGQGTTFRLRLPVGADTPQLDEAETSEISAPEEPFEKAFRSADRSWRSLTDATDLPMVGSGQHVVLVADDESDMRSYVVSLLSEDYRVVQTQDGSNVTSLVAEHGPELVLLDWMMPGKDGLTVCRELRTDPRNRDLKIVLLTARIDEKSKLDALQSGADDFLTKPFSSIEVKTRVANLLRSARLQKDLRLRNDELTATIDKLQRTETMLIQSEKMNAIGSLSAGLLHEINNPLNYTLTAISFATQRKASLTPEMQEILADVEEGMIRIRNVVTDLKSFAYPEKTGAESLFSLQDVFQSARKIMAGEMAGIEIDVDLPEELIIRGQKTQIMHLFINLLGNAARALNDHPTNRPKVVTVRATVAEDLASVEVADNGPGIPEDIINRVFEPFFTTRDVGSGMGMGLSICHTIMEAHHGTIRVGNRADGGAVFTINLPLAEPGLKLCTGYALDSTGRNIW